MKKIIILTLLLLTISMAFAQNRINRTLDNGMQVIVEENHNTDLVGLYCFVKTGAVHEDEYLGSGLSHYLEHIVSGGTTKFHTEEEYKAMQNEMGAIVNAFTNYNTTAYHITVGQEYKEKALQILSENVLNCEINEDEFEREKGVILKEIVLRSTPPRAKMFQKFNEEFYQVSNKQNPIIGYTNLFKKVSREQLKDYYQKRYAPNNMVFVAVGNINAEETFELINSTFSQYERKRVKPVYIPQEPKKIVERIVEREFEVELPTVMMKQIIPESDLEDLLAIQMGLNILMGKRSSKLQKKLIEEDKTLNYLYGYATLDGPNREGFYQIGFETNETNDYKKVINKFKEDFKNAVEEGFSEKDIKNFIEKRKQEIKLIKEKLDKQCVNIGISTMTYGYPNVDESHIKAYEKITSDDIIYALEKHIIDQPKLIFCGVPKGTLQETQKDNKTAFESLDKKIQIDENISLIYQTKNSDRVYGSFAISTGKKYESYKEPGFIDYVLSLALSGSKEYPSEELSEWKSNNSISIRSSANNNYTYISFECFKEDLPELTKRLTSCLENPEFSQKDIDLMKTRYEAYSKRSKKEPGTLHNNFRSKTLYGDKHRSGVSLEREINFFLSLDKNDFEDYFEKYIKHNGEFVISLIGDLSEKEAIKYSEKFYKKLPKGKINSKKNPIKIVSEAGKYSQKYDFEQVNIDMNFKVPNSSSKDAAAIHAVEAVLSGSRGRLFKAARGENDLAYTINSYYSSDKDFAFFRISTQTSIDKKDEIIKVINEEIEKLQKGQLTQEEINTSAKNFVQLRKNYIKGLILARFNVSNELRYKDYKHLDSVKKKIMSCSPEVIAKAAKKYLADKTVIISEPNDNVKKMVE